METEKQAKSNEPLDALAILEHPLFPQHIVAEIRKYTHRTAPSGQRFLRTPVDSLIERGIIMVNGEPSPENVITEFDRVCRKVSMLSSSERSAIDLLIVNSAEALLATIKQQEEYAKRNVQKQKSSLNN